VKEDGLTAGGAFLKSRNVSVLVVIVEGWPDIESARSRHRVTSDLAVSAL
jgi:hypothetical protein